MLRFLCGKMAAGKSTLARELAARTGAVLLVQDDLLETLYRDEIRDLADFARCSTRLQAALTGPIRALLTRGIPVVLDFPANTPSQRRWFRELLDGAGVDHELHFVDADDDLCKRQLAVRSAALPVGSPWTTAAEFDAVTAYFRVPLDEEGFVVVRHARA